MTSSPLPRGDELVDVSRVDLDIEDVDIGETLEEDRFALHDGLARQGADVAQTQHRRTVADDRDQVALGRVAKRKIRIAGDLSAGFGHTRGIGEREILLSLGRLGRGDLDLSGSAIGVVGEGLLSRHQFPTSCMRAPGRLRAPGERRAILSDRPPLR